MDDFGIIALAIALGIVWLIVTICSFFGQPEKDDTCEAVDGSAGWNSPRQKPDERGRYCTRVPGKSHTESMSTYWNGERWIYLGGFECYIQEREWRELPAAMPEGAS